MATFIRPRGRAALPADFDAGLAVAATLLALCLAAGVIARALPAQGPSANPPAPLAESAPATLPGAAPTGVQSP